MDLEKRFKILAPLLLIILILPYHSHAEKTQTEKVLPIAIEQQVVELKGLDLPELLGVSYEKMSLFVYEQGVLAPIPYQFDDINEQGSVYFSKGRFPLKGQEGILDEHDSLLLLFSDLGAKLYDYKAYGNRILAEVKVSHFDEDRYVYVLQGVQTKIDHYVSFNRETGLLKTNHMSIKTNPDNFLDWQKVIYNNYNGPQHESLLDTIKLRLNAGLLTSVPRATLDNRNIDTTIIDVHHGPIRTTLLLDTKIKVLKIPVMAMDLQFSLLPQEIAMRAFIDVPPVLAKLLNQPNASITIDGNDLHGSIIRTALGSKEPVIVDGKMDERELELVKQGGINNEHTWMWLSTRRNLDLMALLYVPKNFHAPISLFYEDDKNLSEKPERFLGQSPRLGYMIHHIPVNDTFDFQLNLLLSDNMSETDPQEFARLYKTQPLVHSLSNEYAVNLVKNDIR